MEMKKRIKPRRLLAYAALVLALAAILFLLVHLTFRHRVLQHSQASRLYAHNKLDQAEKIWSKSAGKLDGDHIPENSKGKAQYKRGRYGQARDWLQKAVKENGKVPGAHYDLGNALYRGDDLKEALAQYKAAMLLDPQDQDAKSNYELVLRKQGYQPPPPPQDGNDGEDQEQNEPQQSPQEKQEQYNNTLDALDQKEALDRMARKKPPNQNDGGKWW